MASQRIRERAEKALEYAKDLLLDDENVDEDDLVEDDESESGTKEEDHDGQNDKTEVDDEKAKEPKSDKDPKSKKSSKGMIKKAKRLMDVVLEPFGSKFHWKVNFSLGVNASNQKEQQEGKTDPPAGTSGIKSGNADARKRDDESLSPDAMKIKSLEKDNKELQKLASKFLDGCIRLEKKLSELSKMEGQFNATQADNDRLKTELRDVQELKQGLTCSMEIQNEQHRNDVKRLDSELKNTKDSLEKMKFTNQSQAEASRKLKKELESISKAKEDSMKHFEEKEASYRLELDKLQESLQHKNLQNIELTDRVHKLNDNLKTASEQIKESKELNMVLQLKIREADSEKHRINLLLDASNAKITELRRAIEILESDPSTTTMAQMQSGGAFSCPLCGAQFGSLANMQLHAEDCNG